MPRTVIAGEPGETWTNGGDKILWQLHCSFFNSCGLCISFAGQISTWWACPFHRGCVCWQIAIAPGHSAAPFVDYMEAIRDLDPVQKARVMGRGLWQLVDKGVVDYSEAVTKARVRTLAEVVGRNKLSVEQLTKAGLTKARAELAYASAHTEAISSAELQRRAMVGILRGHGLLDSQIKAALATEIAGRVGIATREPVRQVPQTPPAPLPKPLPTPAKSSRPKDLPVPVPVSAATAPTARTTAAESVPAFGLSKAKVTHRAFTEAEILTGAEAVLGREVTLADIATLGGAPDDAKVQLATIGPAHDRAVAVSYQGDGYFAYREIRSEGGRAFIKNEEFKVEKDRQGQGLGTQVFGRQVERAAALGVTKLETYAGKSRFMNGYYTWPRFGYDGPIPAYVAETLPESLKGSTDLSDLMKTSEGREWWKTYGVGARMEFDLKADSLSRRVWEGYLAEKARPN